MPRLRLVVLALLAGPLVSLLGGLAPHAAAAASGITLRGSRTASVDVTLPATSWNIGRSDLGLSTSGRYGGYLVQHLPDLTVVAGAVRIPSMEGAYAPLPMAVTSATSLPAGRYRLTLLAEGSSSVRIELPGVAAGTYTPASRLDSTATLVAIGQTGSLRLSTSVRPTRSTFVASSADAAYGQTTYASACVVATKDSCETTTGNGGFLYTQPGATNTHALHAQYYAPGALADGSWEAAYRSVTTGVKATRLAFLLTVG